MKSSHKRMQFGDHKFLNYWTNIISGWSVWTGLSSSVSWNSLMMGCSRRSKKISMTNRKGLCKLFANCISHKLLVPRKSSFLGGHQSYNYYGLTERKFQNWTCHVWQHMWKDIGSSGNLRCRLIFLNGCSRIYRVASLRAGRVGSYNRYICIPLITVVSK